MRPTIISIYFVVLFFSLVVSFLTYKNFQFQIPLVYELNKNDLKLGVDQINEFTFPFLPTITATGVPMKALKGRYYLKEDKYHGVTLLKESIKDNPHIGFSEANLALFYLNADRKDSALYYSKIAYEKLPQNKFHIQVYFESLHQNKIYTTFDSVFNNLPSFIKKDEFLWKLYLTRRVQNKKLEEKDSILTQKIDEAIKLFPSNYEFILINKISKIGLEKVNEAKELFTTGNEYFKNQEFEKAKEYFEKTVTIDTYDFSYFESIAGVNYVLKDYEQAIKYSSIVIDSFDIPNGKSHYIKGLSLIQLGKKSEGCTYLNRSDQMNYPNAKFQIKKYCTPQIK